MPKTRAAYDSSQIAAHWLIVFLVACQFLTGGGMEALFDRATETGALPRDGGALIPHGVVGLSILIVMSARLYMRLSRGVPPAPETEPGWMKTLSRGTHWAFYGLLIAMPLAGMAAVWTISPTIGALHGLASKVLLLLIVLHLGGALWHAFGKRDGVVRRMMRGGGAEGASS